jgi:hypothetical protein
MLKYFKPLPGMISKLENDASGYYQKSLPKKLTKTYVTFKILDKKFSKDTWKVHQSIIHFLTNMKVNYKNQLHPCFVPVNHNSLNEAKSFIIAHTMLGNFCHGDEDKNLHMENMGNSACVVVRFDNMVRIQQRLFIFHDPTIPLTNYKPT